MKTLEQVEKEISDIKATDTSDWRDAQKKQLGRTLSFITKTRNYLEFENTSEELAQKHLDRQIKIVIGLEKRYSEWCSHTDMKDIKNPIQKFRTEVGITGIKKKIKILEYVLG